MYYFIPAWYGAERKWHVDIVPWYRTTFKLEFDDTFNQIRLLQGQGIKSHLLLLSYQPHLRYFLHRHGILEVDTYSVFDDLQNLHDIHSQVLQLKDIEWDRDCEFLFSPFAIVVQKKGHRYAQVELGVEGFISDIYYFDEDGQPMTHYIMDDRGFVSSVIYLENGQPHHQDYLDTTGIWQFREFLQDNGRVEINPIFGYRFNLLNYRNLGQLIAEFFERRLARHHRESDLFILPADSFHNDFVLSRLPEKSYKILSLFVGRNSQESLSELADILDRVVLTLVDREDSLEFLRKLFYKKADRIHHLSPFDTRLRLGKSQTRKESLIYYQLTVDEEIDKEGICQILSFVSTTKDTEVIFGVYGANQEQMESIEMLVQEVIQERISLESLQKPVEFSKGENPLEENQQQELRFQFVNINDELDLLKTLEYVRLIVDLSKQPHLYTQIAGISAGIPQINQVETVYVDHLQNGYLLSELSELNKAIHYYLDTLKAWNQSLIYSIDKIKEHTGQRFLEKLYHWLGEVTNVK